MENNYEIDIIYFFDAARTGDETKDRKIIRENYRTLAVILADALVTTRESWEGK